ncbi:MAG TPA: Arm DNA-binding domain-containing protein, partial [Tepidisphaeraceae bacterium]|nr:Arm DNA-binding domain-containing protein [Tepidisphaeraceae bacterium]
MRLTDLTIRSLHVPEKGQKTYADDTVPGFGIRISQGGTKTFVLVHGANRERTTIGRWPVISLADARSEARRILAEYTLGKHRPKRIQFADALALFIDAHCRQNNRPGTARNTER